MKTQHFQQPGVSPEGEILTNIPIIYGVITAISLPREMHTGSIEPTGIHTPQPDPLQIFLTGGGFRLL